MATIKKKYMDQKILIWIDSELLAKLGSFKNKKGWSRSFVIREAIKEFIKRG